MILAALTVLALLGWLYLLIGRRGFWRWAPVIEEQPDPPPAAWPDVVAVVPARDEEVHVGRALRSLLAQDYRGRLRVVLVDDHSTDRTREIAEQLRREAPERLEVVSAPPLPPGWTGKLAALATGIRRADASGPAFLWFSDADIEHDPGTLTRLVAKAKGEEVELVSLMVELSVATPIERLLIPPFVFFFRMLYPFAAVNDPGTATAAAAGGCLLLRHDVLRSAGGLERIRARLIDDVALATLIKTRPGGTRRIWLGLTAKSRSLRRYRSIGPIWRMVARTADEQLGHSVLWLAATVGGMALLYLLPPLAVVTWPVHHSALAAALGVAALTAILAAYRPTARAYGLHPRWLATLPVAAIVYLLMTVDSAQRFRRGSGGSWKGRTVHDVVPEDTVPR
jgi:hopene-associated glycosyltransferase HpnB